MLASGGSRSSPRRGCWMARLGRVGPPAFVGGHLYFSIGPPNVVYIILGLLV